MAHKSIFLVWLFCGMLLMSCNNKQQPVDELRDFSTELQEKSDHYTRQDWQEAEQRMNDINAELEKYQYTKEEQQQIGELKGRCWTYFMKGAVKNSAEELEQFANEMTGAIKGVTDALTNDSTDTNE